MFRFGLGDVAVVIGTGFGDNAGRACPFKQPCFQVTLQTYAAFLQEISGCASPDIIRSVRTDMEKQVKNSYFMHKRRVKLGIFRVTGVIFINYFDIGLSEKISFR